MFSRRLLIVAVVGLFSTAHADTIYVDDDNCPGPGDGSKLDPFCSIQDAIDAALDGDEVVVSDGVYSGVGNKNIGLCGLAIVVRSANGPQSCLIDCEGDGQAFSIDCGMQGDAVIEGFTIANGYDWFGGAGGAIYVANSSPTIRKCVFLDNDAGPQGPGVGGWGGALFVAYGSPDVIDCVFAGNVAHSSGDGPGGGGGLCCLYSSPTLVNCVFLDNSAAPGAKSGSAGGGMMALLSTPTIINCTFAGNSVSGGGGQDPGAGGLHIAGDTPAFVANCIFWSNGADQITDSPGSSITVRYSDVEGGWPGAGNVDVDPLFGAPGGAAYHLSPGSPCIDAGDNTAVPEGITTDLDGNPRFVDDPETVDTGYGDPPIVDMGAFEFQGVSCPWDCQTSADGIVNILDFLKMLAQWGAPGSCDFDGNGVDYNDFVELMANWGPCP
ncbi:MAG: choice-of-anchor Q domain-containing protein [Planctomycetota bacterium]